MAYFQDIRSGYVLKFDTLYDVEQLRKQIGDYKEVTEAEYNECHNITPKKTETLHLPKK